MTPAVCALFILLSSSAAYADVVWEPEDGFYNSHIGDCLSLKRAFKVNSIDEEGLKIYESPESSKVVNTVPNGEEIYVEYTYTDAAGNEWGLNEYYAGWFPMDYLSKIYDDVEFDNQYSSQFISKSGEVELPSAGEDEVFYLYPYPGAKEYNSYFEVRNTSDNPYYTTVFNDPEGHSWGSVGYYYGSEGWICLDAPTADYDTLYPNGQTFSGIISDEVNSKPTIVVEPIEKGINTKIVVGLVIGGIIIATGVIIGIVIIGRGRKKQQ